MHAAKLSITHKAVKKKNPGRRRARLTGAISIYRQSLNFSHIVLRESTPLPRLASSAAAAATGSSPSPGVVRWRVGLGEVGSLPPSLPGDPDDLVYSNGPDSR